MMPTNPKELQAEADAKAPLDYLEPVADAQAAWALYYGAQKYGRRNYRDTPMKMTTYVGAVKRHVAEWQTGIDEDEADGLHPLAHIIACCHVMLAAIEEGTAVDDRHDKHSTPRSAQVHTADKQQLITTDEIQSRYFAYMANVYGLDKQQPAVEPFTVHAECCMGGDHKLNEQCAPEYASLRWGYCCVEGHEPDFYAQDN